LHDVPATIIEADGTAAKPPYAVVALFPRGVAPHLISGNLG